MARAYVESLAYGGTYIDEHGHTQKLPTIRNLILGADPALGTPHTFRPWTGDFQDVLSGFIPTTEISGRLTALAYEYVLAGGVVTGPGLDGTPDGGDISLKDILKPDKNGQLRPDETTFFRLYTALRQDLMPTYDFLELPGTTTLINVNDDPSIGSAVSQTLNGFSASGVNPWAESGRVSQIIATMAPGARQATQGVLYDFENQGAVDANPYIDTLYAVDQENDPAATYLPLPGLLFPNPADHEQTVGSDLFPRIATDESTTAYPIYGDGNVPFVSGISTYEGDTNISLVFWGNTAAPDASQLPYGAAESWTELSGYPVFHSYFFTNSNVDAYVASEFSGSSVTPDPAASVAAVTKEMAESTSADAAFTSLANQLNFTSNLYRTVLGRAADDAGLRFWTSALANNASRQLVAQAFWESPEHRGLQVDQLYATYLHQSPDAPGRAFWVNQLEHGGTGVEIALALIAAPQYSAAHPGTDAFLAGLYSDILGRSADATGLAAWQMALNQAGTPRSTVAAAFLNGDEAIRNEVIASYEQILGRVPDSAGGEAWVNALLSGQTSPDQFAESLLASDEFFAMSM